MPFLPRKAGEMSVRTEGVRRVRAFKRLSQNIVGVYWQRRRAAPLPTYEIAAQSLWPPPPRRGGGEFFLSSYQVIVSLKA